MAIADPVEARVSAGMEQCGKEEKYLIRGFEIEGVTGRCVNL